MAVCLHQTYNNNKFKIIARVRHIASNSKQKQRKVLNNNTLILNIARVSAIFKNFKMAVATSCLEGLFTSNNHNKLKLGLNIPRVSAILSKIQNGAFVYHNKLSTASHCVPHCLHNIASGCFKIITNQSQVYTQGHSPLRHLC